MFEWWLSSSERSFLCLKKAYEKRMRGEQEEEESEDEISSHKTVVTKFLNKVQFQLAFTEKGLFSYAQLFLLFSP